MPPALPLFFVILLEVELIASHAFLLLLILLFLCFFFDLFSSQRPLEIFFQVPRQGLIIADEGDPLALIADDFGIGFDVVQDQGINLCVRETVGFRWAHTGLGNVLYCIDQASHVNDDEVFVAIPRFLYFLLQSLLDLALVKGIAGEQQIQVEEEHQIEVLLGSEINEGGQDVRRGLPSLRLQEPFAEDLALLGGLQLKAHSMLILVSQIDKYPSGVSLLAILPANIAFHI